MLRERVTEDVFVFISSLYAEVSAVVVTTPDGAVVIDTLPFPEETSQVREFALRRCPRGIRYVINTHHHADHVYGSYLFPEAELIAHRLSLGEIQDRLGVDSLGYLSIEGLRGVSKELKHGICDACFSQEYPVPVEGDQGTPQLSLFREVGEDEPENEPDRNGPLSE